MVSSIVPSSRDPEQWEEFLLAEAKDRLGWLLGFEGVRLARACDRFALRLRHARSVRTLLRLSEEPLGASSVLSALIHAYARHHFPNQFQNAVKTEAVASREHAKRYSEVREAFGILGGYVSSALPRCSGDRRERLLRLTEDLRVEAQYAEGFSSWLSSLRKRGRRHTDVGFMRLVADARLESLSDAQRAEIVAGLVRDFLDESVEARRIRGSSRKQRHQSRTVTKSSKSPAI